MFLRFCISFIAANVITLLIVLNQSVIQEQQAQSVVQVEPRPLPIFAVGLVEGARPEIELHFETEARVREVFVEEGDRVVAGQRLARLDTKEHELRLRMAEARLSQASLVLQAAQASNPQDRAMWEARLRAKRAELNREQKTLERNSELLQQDAIAEQTFDNQYWRAAVLRAEVESLEAQLRKLDQPATRERLEVLESEVAAAEVAVELANLELDRCSLRAPCDGVITEIEIEPGELIQRFPNVLPSIKLVDDARRRVCAYVEEPDALRVKPGMKAHIHVRGSNSEVPLTGVISQTHPQFRTKEVVSRRADERFDVRTRECWIDLAPHPNLILGAHVDVLIEHGQ